MSRVVDRIRGRPEILVALMRRRLKPAIRAGERGEAVEHPKIRTAVRRLRRLTPEDIDELVGARLAGEEINALAERFGIDRNTVMAHLMEVVPASVVLEVAVPRLRPAGW